MVLEQAGAHESGDCLVDCTHPDCVWAERIDLSIFGAGFDDVEAAQVEQAEPVLL